MKVKISKENIFLWALSLTIFIDFINGFFRGLHIGEVYRAILLIYCASIIFSGNRKEAGRFALVLSFIFINITISALRDGASEALRTDVNMGLKTILFYTISSSILLLYRKGKFQKDTIDKIIRFNLLYTPILFALSSVMGGGNAGYNWIGESIGTKSEFLSLNSINSAMMLMYIYCIYHMYSEKKKTWAIGAIYIAVPMLTLGTKTSIAMVVFVPVFFALLRIRNRRTIRTVLIVTAILIVVLPVAWPYIMDRMSRILNRQMYLFTHRSFFSYLTSTRNERVAVVWDYYIHHFSIFDIFPGGGYHYTHHIVSNLMGYSSDVIPIEMDWMDILTAYGVWGFLYTYVYATKPFFKYRNVQKNDNSKMYFWIIVILVTFGSFAGHVFTEAISSTFLAIAFCGYYMSMKEAVTNKELAYDKVLPDQDRGYKGRQVKYE